MRSMQELRTAREEIENEMRQSAQSETETIRQKVIGFFDKLKDEYGFYDIYYEVGCQWENPDYDDAIGIDEIQICNN